MVLDTNEGEASGGSKARNGRARVEELFDGGLEEKGLGCEATAWLCVGGDSRGE